ncbi:putative holin-like toxin [Virgibacillus necropolis]
MPLSIFEVFMIVFAFGTFLTGLLTLVEKMINKK